MHTAIIHLPTGTEIIRPGQALPASKLPEAGKLQQALESTRICNDSVENLKQVLRLVMIKIGLRANNWPTKEEKPLLIDHIIKNYGGHTCEEIKLAFEMAMAGKLELCKDESVNCFENFSCLYFSAIMNAYRKWAKEAYKEFPQKELPPPKEEPMTDEEFITMNFGIWQTLGKRGMIAPKVYYMLVKQGKINLTQDQKDLMYKKVEGILIAKVGEEKMVRDSGKKKAYDHQLINIYDSPNKERWATRVFTECKQMAVEEYFKTL